MLKALSSATNLLASAPPLIPGEKKYGVMSITVEELAPMMRGAVAEAKIEKLDIKIADIGTSDRARLFIEWNQAGKDAGLPVTAFAKGTPSQMQSRFLLAFLAGNQSEARFFNEIYPEVPDLTIKPYVSRAGIGGRYVVAFEDMQKDSIELYDVDSAAPLEHAEGVMDVLGKLHGRYWQSPRFSKDLSWLNCASERTGLSILKWVYSWSGDRFFKQDRDLPESMRRLTELFTANQDTLIKFWDSLPATLTHGDCHLGNSYYTSEGNSGIYDWQAVHLMSGVRDFAYFMVNSVPIDTRRQQEETLLRRYLDGLAAAGAGKEAPDFNEAWELYRLLAIEGWITIVVTGAFGGLQSEERVIAATERGIAAMEDLEVEAALKKALRSG